MRPRCWWRWTGCDHLQHVSCHNSLPGPSPFQWGACFGVSITATWIFNWCTVWCHVGVALYDIIDEGHQRRMYSWREDHKLLWKGFGFFLCYFFFRKLTSGGILRLKCSFLTFCSAQSRSSSSSQKNGRFVNPIDHPFFFSRIFIQHMGVVWEK